jgi:ABC-2 type transport system ATP-binding protein
VFVSSHLLSEVQQTCDRVAVLARGRCVAAGPVDEVLAAGGSQGLIVRLAELERGRMALAEAGIETTLETDHLRVALPPAEAERVTRALVDKGLYLTELRPQEISLEAVFLELTGEHPVEEDR